MPVPAATTATAPPIRATSQPTLSTPRTAAANKARVTGRLGHMLCRHAARDAADRRARWTVFVEARLEAAPPRHPLVHFHDLARLRVPSKMLDGARVRRARMPQPQLAIIDVALQH